MKTLVKVLVVLSLFLVIGVSNTLESTYTREGVVVSVDHNTVTVQDAKGYQWDFEGTGYTLNQEITMVMSDNHTSTIFDDTVLRVKE